MTNLNQASKEWSSRPADERFTSLAELSDFVNKQRSMTRAGVLSSRGLTALPAPSAIDPQSGESPDLESLFIRSDRTGHIIKPTHWSFSQLCQRAQAPAKYLRSLPAPMAADCINYGLKCSRDVEEIGVKVQTDESGNPETLRCATGPNYGTIWNSDLVTDIRSKFEGSDWKVPGEFGVELDQVTKENTTLFASDRDMFVFLADEKNRVELPNRRDGKTGTLARGFFVWNSEVGDKTCGAAFFLFDYACKNRIVWGAEQFKEVRLRHTSSAPDRWLEEITPVLRDYSNAAASTVEQHLIAAQNHKVDNVLEFLTKRYNKERAAQYVQAFVRDENREPESLWDITTGMTAHARSFKNTDSRVELEREAGKILAMAG